METQKAVIFKNIIKRFSTYIISTSEFFGTQLVNNCGLWFVCRINEPVF